MSRLVYVFYDARRDRFYTPEYKILWHACESNSLARNNCMTLAALLSYIVRFLPFYVVDIHNPYSFAK